jgi:hypothetical protein
MRKMKNIAVVPCWKFSIIYVFKHGRILLFNACQWFYFLRPFVATWYFPVFAVFRLYHLFNWFDDVRTHLFQ